MDISQKIAQNNPTAEIKHFKKGEILLRKGQTTTRSFFVKKGLLRSYIIDSKGKENIFIFAPEGWVIADLESQEFDQPSELFIDCLEDSEVVVYDKNSLIDQGLNSEDTKAYFTLLFRRIGILQRRVLMLMSSPAIDRYTYFLATYPQLPNRVPQHMIAAYLGITPQALSTIRGKIVRNK